MENGKWKVENVTKDFLLREVPSVCEAGGVKHKKLLLYPSQSAPLTALPRGEPFECFAFCYFWCKSNHSLPFKGGGNPSEF